MNDVTRVIAAALAADPAAREAMRRLLTRLPPMGDAPRGSAVWREGHLRLLRQAEALCGVRTALVVHAARHAPAAIEGYGALLAWAADRVDWRVVARLAMTRHAAGAARRGAPATAGNRQADMPRDGR